MTFFQQYNMNPTENLQRIIEGKNNLITSITNKGVIVPENTLIDDLYQYVDDIQTGGSGDNWFSKLSLGKFPEVITPNMFDQADGTALRYMAFGYVSDYYNSTTKKAILPDWITEIGSYAFSRCTALTEVHIPNNITKLGGYVFDGAPIVNLDLSNTKLTTINGTSCLSGMGKLETISFPSTLTTINSNYCFSNDKSLKLVLPDTITTLSGSGMFQSGVKSVELPSTLEYSKIGNSVFQSASGTPIGELIIKSNILSGTSTTSNFMYNKVYSSASYRGITKITTKGNCTEVGNYALYSGTSTTTIELGDEIRTIGISAAQSCTKLNTLNIGSGCTSIGNNAFSGCTALTSISITAPQPPTLGSNVFAGSTCPIYVPIDSLFDYVSAWSAYASRIQPMGSDNTILYSVNDNNIAVVNPLGFKDENGDALNIVDNSLYSFGKGYIKLSGDVHEFDGSFADCSNLTDISIPSTLEKIGDLSFAGTQLGVLDFTSSLPELTEDALTNSNVKLNVNPIDFRSFYSDKLVCIPPNDEIWYWNSSSAVASPYSNSSSYFGNQTFISNTYDKYGIIKLGGTVTWLQTAFRGSGNFTDIYLPDSVTELRTNTLYGNNNIKNVFGNNITASAAIVNSNTPKLVLRNTTTPWGSNSYNRICIFYVPSDTVSAWKANSYTKVYPLEDFRFE